MFVIGLTGNIATGKSSVAKMLTQFGVKVIDADVIAKRMLWRNSSCFVKIVHIFGKIILTKGRINRKKLAEIIFNNPRKRKSLEGIIHPQVEAVFKKRLRMYKQQKRYAFVALDVPLLFESGMHGLADTIVVVKSTKEQQIVRTVKSGRFERSEILRRMNAQMPLKDKIHKSDFCIDNTGTKKQTQKQVEGLWQKLQQMVKK